MKIALPFVLLLLGGCTAVAVVAAPATPLMVGVDGDGSPYRQAHLNFFNKCLTYIVRSQAVEKVRDEIDRCRVQTDHRVVFGFR